MKKAQLRRRSFIVIFIKKVFGREVVMEVESLRKNNQFQWNDKTCVMNTKLV